MKSAIGHELDPQESSNPGVDHREIREIRENRVVFVRIFRMARGERASLLCVLRHFAENQWKRLSMNDLRAKPSFSDQVKSS